MKSIKLLITLLVLSIALYSCEGDQISPYQTENLTKPRALALNWLPTNWMANINGNMKISDISIPGTHDAGARFDHVILKKTAKCQDLTISEQLNIGVRFLDIRCRHIENSFTIHHGVVYQNINFDDVINYCNSFLAAHPTETIVMSVKEEHEPSNNTRSFEETFDFYTNKNPHLWHLADEIPLLSDVRGKIVLFRRFGASAPKGINASYWPDNAVFTNNTPLMGVQDVYNVPNNSNKWNLITDHFNQALSNSNGKLFINFTSGSKPGIFNIPDINAVSDFMNPKLVEYFNTPRSGKHGIIIMDFASTELVSPIIETNF